MTEWSSRFQIGPPTIGVMTETHDELHGARPVTGNFAIENKGMNYWIIFSSSHLSFSNDSLFLCCQVFFSVTGFRFQPSVTILAWRGEGFEGRVWFRCVRTKEKTLDLRSAPKLPTHWAYSNGFQEFTCNVKSVSLCCFFHMEPGWVKVKWRYAGVATVWWNKRYP